jgi:type VI secretion system protein ImpE
MTDADTLLREGDITGARTALVDIVRSRPGDAQARMFLFQLLAVAGEWDKAGAQLNALVQIDSEAQMLAVTYNQAMEGERLRAAVFAGQADMPLLLGEGGWADGVARAITLLARGDATSAGIARDEAFDSAPEMPGSVNGARFEWLADADSRFGPTFEAIVGGRYGLIPFDQVSAIVSEGPRDLKDTIWYPVQIAFRDGHSAAAFLPARYPGSENSGDDAVRLGRVTNWLDCDWGQQGSGQKLLMFSEGEELGLLEIQNLTFD